MRRKYSPQSRTLRHGRLADHHSQSNLRNRWFWRARVNGALHRLDERPISAFLSGLLVDGRLNASYDKGVLTLTIPASEQAKPRRVKISAEPGQQPQPVGTSAGQPMSEPSLPS